METLNRIRCWLRDTLPREQWPGTDFSDAIILDREACPWVPNDLREFAERLETFEKDTRRYLRREMRLHPLWPFFEQVRGVGEVSAARLMHRIKDPRRFANPAKLWSYAGMDGPGWKARPHSWPLTKVLWNIAESFQKQKPDSGCVYRDVYDKRKAIETTKPACETCQAAGFADHCRPAHVNNRARRYAVKMLLLDLWKVAQDERAEEAAN